MPPYENGMVLVALYIESNLLIVHPDAVDNTICQLEVHGLMLKIEDNLHDFVLRYFIFRF